MRHIAAAVITIAGLAHAEPVALNRAFHGRVVDCKDRTVTLFNDFEDPEQLKDFEEARPMRYLDACKNQARIENGKLVLEGSTSIRHRMESRDEIFGRFSVRPSKLHNIGAVITEPVLSEFYILYNLFEHRFSRTGLLHVAGVGLHEDEGAEDMRSGLVNYRDIVSRDVRGEFEDGEAVVVEIRKDRFDERITVGRLKNKGSSKGKTKDLRNLKFGLFVHGSKAVFDDLTITCTLSDDYLDLEDLSVDLTANIDAEIEAYEKRGLDPGQIASIVAWPFVDKKKRKAAAAALAGRGDLAVLALILPALRSDDRTTRKLAIEVVEGITGQTFGYRPNARRKDRDKAIAKLRSAIRK